MSYYHSYSSTLSSEIVFVIYDVISTIRSYNNDNRVGSVKNVIIIIIMF